MLMMPFSFFLSVINVSDGCDFASVKFTIKEELWKSNELVKLASITVAETVPQWIPLSYHRSLFLRDLDSRALLRFYGPLAEAQQMGLKSPAR